ncbi:hypothetical protein CUMW_131770 [Citrus unshiu]|uniref:THH1/TOM1/TOM3 domain-containing protein n=1 Tax=Citrus unshiu TaxID=55188 RepID=A0A2H5PFJ1_CITUN|nr:hypothetical protein CUMW_131770 [Citrus unshiu]
MEPKTVHVGLDESFRPLPSLYLAFLSIWFLSACSWTINTYKNRHFRANNLQWTLASVPLIKALQLTLSFLYSCFHLQICSLWMSFGVYVTGILFQTASFVSFLLISHGYCIMCERLSVTERRSTAALGCVFYLTLVGYRASVPYFTVLLLLNYFISFYVIFHHISQNLAVLREQLAFIEDEDVQAMHDAVYTKYIMFKKFQGAMQIVAMAETVIYLNVDDSSENYWLRLLVREWAQFCIFLYIGYEMDAAAFKDFSRHEWHIGVPTSRSHDKSSKESVLVIIQHPNAHRLSSTTSSSPSTSPV